MLGQVSRWLTDGTKSLDRIIRRPLGENNGTEYNIKRQKSLGADVIRCYDHRDKGTVIKI